MKLSRKIGLLITFLLMLALISPLATIQTVYAAAPTIDTVSPSSGPTGGGTSITITGTSFATATEVTIGGTVAAFSITDDTHIAATTPDGTVGAQDVVVTNPEGSATKAGGFTYVPSPTVSTINPTSGPLTGGTGVTITGTGFLAGATVTVGGSPATSVTVVNANTITATTPAGTAGAKDVVVINPDTQSGTLAGGFTYVPAPTVTGLSPTSGPTVGNTSVTITGTGFFGGGLSSLVSAVKFGIIDASSYTATSDTTITATSPAGSGTVDVTVTTTGGTSAINANDSFTYVASPTVSAIVPNSGPLAGGTSVTITGTGFLTGAAVTIGGSAATSVTLVNANTITATTPAGTAGAKDVVVTNLDSQFGTLTNGFTYVPAPIISSVSPNSGTQGQTLSAVIITGSYLNNASTINFGTGITVNSSVVNSDTQITVNITIAASTTPGKRDISVTTPGGIGTLADAFTILELQPAPIVSLVYPNSGVQGHDLSVVITGTYLSNASAVSFGSGITINSFNVDNDSQISANISITSSAAPGTRTVSVTTPGGMGTRAGGFTVLQAAPTITTVSPVTGIQGHTLSSVVLTGTYFYNTSSVSFGTGITVNSFIVNSNTQITVNITVTPSATTGTRNVLVTTPGGTGTLVDGFTVLPPAPTITSVSPNSGGQGRTITSVLINGTNFTDVSAVSFGNEIILSPFIVNSSTQITANITIDMAAATGPRDVSVTTPGGTGTLTKGFTVLPAIVQVTSVSPNNGLQGQTLTSVIITGDYLDDTSVVSFGTDITVNIFTVNSPTQITASITIAAYATPDSYDVSITAPFGSATLPDGFKIMPAPPLLTSVSLNSGFLGQTVYVILNGDYFLGVTSVSFGSDITVQLMPFSTTLIFTKITIDTNATPGKRDISVTTPIGTVTLANGFTVSKDAIYIKVVYPNGGEIWEIGTKHTITWTSSGVTGGITIQMSRDGGATWKTLIVSTDNSGFYSWSVTGPETNEGRIKVFSAVYPNIFDMSDLNFIIPAPIIKVNSPDTGVVWNIGTEQTITWQSSSSIKGKVRIQLSRDGGSTWKTLKSSTSNDGVELWKISGPPTNHARIKVISLSNPNIYDISDADFAISAGNILITSPDGGEVWQIGTKHTITWTSNGVTSKIRIQISRDEGQTWKTVKSSTSNSGSYTWKVTGPASNLARIRVLNKSYQTVFDVSDANFTITQ